MPKSTLKPEVQQKPVVELEYNDMDRKAYTDLGLEAPSEIGMWERRFLNLVDFRKGDIQRNVTVMVRLKAPDYSDPKKARKEYVYYQEEWSAKDIHDVEIFMRQEHFEGKYTKRFLRPHINPKTGDTDYMELDITKRQVIHTIPWSKKTVDEIMDKSANTGKDSIKFCIKFTHGDATELGYADRQDNRTYVSYDMFVNWSFEDLFYYNLAPANQYYDRKSESFKVIGVQVPIQQISHIT